ncbi:MAG: hypothetical protein CVU59_07665 [Deltaproteobacteria bacterium HGW-Deltaproteobacteria-17]|nr:MAG: hypothetical protein CVU59_07665 [Deltaproteobacteria bacterium HGW-Deltaproteobacteria-17]
MPDDSRPSTGDLKMLTLSCNECGAPIDVPERTNFFTCNFCGSRLSVQRTEGASYTETLEALDRKTETLAREVEVLKLQNELERVDREWQEELKQYMVRDNNGNESVPTSGGSIIGGFVAIVFGIGWMVQAVSVNAPAFLPLVGLGFIGMGVYMGFSGYNKSLTYKAAYQRHLGRRDDLIRQLNALK